MCAAWGQGSGKWPTNADGATWEDKQGWQDESAIAGPERAQDAGWSQKGSPQDGVWAAKKKTQTAADPGEAWDGNDMARSLDIERSQQPLSPPMPEDPAQLKWYHDVLPQFVYRIVCPDFDCTKKKYMPSTPPSRIQIPLNTKESSTPVALLAI